MKKLLLLLFLGLSILIVGCGTTTYPRNYTYEKLADTFISTFEVQENSYIVSCTNGSTYEATEIYENPQIGDFIKVLRRMWKIYNSSQYIWIDYEDKIIVRYNNPDFENY